MALTLPTWIGDPIGWVNTQLTMFLGLPERYDAMLVVARNVFTAEAQYRAAHGNYSTQSPRELAAITVINEIEQAKRAWQATRDRLVVERQDSLGQVALAIRVVAIVGTVAVVVWSIIGLIRQAGAAERFVFDTLPNMPGVTPDQALEAFRLQANEKSAIEQLLGGIAKIIAFAALVLGVYFLAPAIARRVR